MKEYITKKKLYPDVSKEEFENINKILGKFGISIEFLLDDGICFSYNENDLEIKNFPGDFSFYDKGKNNLLVTYIETIGKVEFIDLFEREILSFKILENI